MEHRDAEALREVEAVTGHFIGLLLARRLENGHQSELAVETRVLLVLRGVHRGVVGRHHHQAAVGAGHGRIDEGVGGDVHAHMLHAYKRPLAGERHAQGLLHRRFLVRGPVAVDSALAGERKSLDIFRDFSRRSSGIGIYPRKSCVDSPERQGFVSE